MGMGMSKINGLLLVLVFLAACYMPVANSTEASIEPAENTWATKAPMPQAISGVKAAVVNGKIYVMSSSSNYQYDPETDNWTTKKSIPTARGFGFAIATIQDKIYVIGGNNGPYGYMNYLSTNEVYDPSTDTWETKAPMPTGRQ